MSESVHQYTDVLAVHTPQYEQSLESLIAAFAWALGKLDMPPTTSWDTLSDSEQDHIQQTLVKDIYKYATYELGLPKQWVDDCFDDVLNMEDV
ncbi:MAG TPA: hypothetical protein PLJ04_01260 [Candidatus Saccharibacteria bacterium]|nr:hypothetical protein [Candidatus Nomurabacteria bacterium]HPR10186.1 hypothetical protein [Candidatus Saccharibacteria bacterium]